MENLRVIVAEAETIRREALNRDDPRIQVWYEEARKAVLQFAPVKLPAFNEIPFASDYFLSRPAEERKRINDRIALVSDFDLALKLLIDVNNLVRRENPATKGEKPPLAPVTAWPKPPIPSGQGTGIHATDLAAVRELAANMGFSSRELDEALAVLDQAGAELAAASPDWDRIKRVVKFLVDFDRKLALAAVPVILSLYASKAGS